MSFWPFCCKSPQVHAASPGVIPDQFCTTYGVYALDRTPGCDAYSVAGSRSGRVVTNPVVFRSACDIAGVSEDGNLYVWGGAAAEAMKYIYSASESSKQRDDSPDKSGAFAISTATHGVFRVGSEGDWNSVWMCGDTTIAVKADGSMWSFGSQFGVDRGNYALQLATQAFRAKVSSPIGDIRTDFTKDYALDFYGFGLPVWFTSQPQSQPVIQKLRMWPRGVGHGEWEPDITVASSEPGSGATASASFRAKIDTGAITGIAIQSAGSGYSPNSSLDVAVYDDEGEGSGAVVRAITNSAGQVSSIFIINPGEGYKHPVTAAVYNYSDDPASEATLSVTPPKRLLLTSGGSGYTSVPEVTVSPANNETAGGGGTSIRVAEMSRCAVESFEVTSQGQGYTFANAVEEKTGATATAVVGDDGSIVSWSLTSQGSANHSPLDDDPLSVTVTGDGTGAAASAVPVGSSILKIDVESNPEVWTRPPVIAFQGGGGSGATAEAEGVIGRLDVTLESGGDGYTKTSIRERKRTQFSPCAAVSSANAVGGRIVGGSVIVGEAILSGGPVSRIDEDAQEFCNPNNSPYRMGNEYTTGFTAQQDSLARHRRFSAQLSIESDGVAHPFEQDIPSETLTSVNWQVPAEDLQAHASQCLSWYLRGPGNVKYPVDCQYVPGEDVYRLTLASPIQVSSPPSLCLEAKARPHNFVYYAEESAYQPNLESQPCWGVYVRTRPKDSAEAWWASPTSGSVLTENGAFFVEGTVTASGPSGATAVYQVVDGRLVFESETRAEAPWQDDGLREGTISGLQPYLGPLREVTLEDPVGSWAQPSSAQRIHFIFRAETGLPARGIATAIYSEPLAHPVLSSIELAEAGGGYTEEPEARLYDAIDPIPINTGYSDCTSAGGLSGGASYAFFQGEMHWWGRNAAIAWSHSGIVPPALAVAEGLSASEWYALKKQSFASPGGYTAKPTPVGGHLRFSASGELRSAGREAGLVWSSFFRLPRPDHGNRCVAAGDVFGSFPDVRLRAGINEVDPWDDTIALVPGVQSSKFLSRYKVWPVRAFDHGAGYVSSATIEYVGPGLSPHTLSVTASIVPNGLLRVGSNGLLQDSEQVWRWPGFVGFPQAVGSGASVRPFFSRTVDAEIISPDGCSQGGEIVTTIADTPAGESRLYEVVVRNAGVGYRETNPWLYLDWSSLGGGQATIEVSGQDLELRPGLQANLDRTFVVDTVPFTYSDTIRTSSYGGLPPYRTTVYSTTPPQVTVSGGGSGATIEVIQVPQSHAKPFRVWCRDQIDSSVEPCPGGLAAASGGLLRVVANGRLYRPEAFGESQSVTAIFLSDTNSYPYLAEGWAGVYRSTHSIPTHCFRDHDGTIWFLHCVTDGVESYDDNKFWLPPQQGEPLHPIVASPLAIAATNTGYGYDYPVAVSVSQPSGVARGSATIDGKVVGVAVIDGGSGYETPPTVVFQGGGAAGVAAIAGPVSKVSVTSGGSGYRLPPRVRFSSRGMGAEAKATLDGGSVSKVSITSGGSYRETPQVFFDPVSDVESVSVTSGGSGYSTIPEVHIAGAGGSGAEAVAKISCSVTEIVLISGGQGYTLPPAVEITGDGTGAAAVAVLDFSTGQVSQVNVVSGGSGYTTPPTVRIAGSAIALAKIAGYVSEVVLTARGKDFEAPPKVIITGGGGLNAQAVATIAAPGGGAAATATINGSVIAVKVTSPGAGLQKPPKVSCNHPPAALGKANAVLKATILGRPTGVTVTSPGSGYVLPLYAANDPPGAKRRTPSRITRRPTVFAKGSFSTTSGRNAGLHGEELPLLPQHKMPSHRNYWLNSYPVLGAAEINGGNTDAGGSVSSVSLPSVVIGIDVINPGQGYTPGTLLAIRYQGGGVLDSRFRLYGESPPAVGTEVAEAYVGHDGKVAGVRTLTSFGTERFLFGLPLGLRAFLSPPAFSVDGNNGAQVVARMGHPLECYYSPQVLFDGSIEADADVSLAIAGASVQQGGLLPGAYQGSGSGKQFLAARRNRWQVLRNRFSQGAGFSWDDSSLGLSGDDPDLRICVTGAVAGLSPARLEGDSPLHVAFFSSPPNITIEDEAGTGAVISPATLPASGSVSEEWVGLATVSQPGGGYTLGARVRLTGGRPLAWDNPASATAVVSQGGTVTSVSISSQGKGYLSPPRVFIVGDGTGAVAVVDEDGIDLGTGSITAIRLVSEGSGYTSASVVLVDQETVAERSDRVAELIESMREKYSILLEDCTVERAYLPPELRRFYTTIAVRTAMSLEQEPSPIGRTMYSSAFRGDFEVSGNRLHPVYSSDGYVEYFRIEGHSGEPLASSPVVTVDATSDTVPLTPATAIAVVPKCSKLLSGLVANISTGGAGFSPYQLTEPEVTGVIQAFDVQDSLTYPQNIVGSGRVVKQGAGTLTLTGDSTFTGTLDVKNGAVIATSPPSVADINIAPGAVVVIAGGGLHGGRVTGTGTLIKRGEGDLTLSDTGGFLGEILLEEGSLSGVVNLSATLVVSGDASLSADIILEGGTLTFDFDEDGEYSGSITGNGTVIKRGSGRLEFNGEADFAGDFVFEASSESLGGNSTFSESVTLKGEASLEDGSLSGVAKVSGRLQVAGGAPLLADVILGGLDGRLVFDIDTGVESQYSGSITGNGTVIKQGEGRLEFNGEAAFNGQFDFKEGILDGQIVTGADTSLVVAGELLADVELGGRGVYWTLYSDAVYDGIISGEGFVRKNGPGLLGLSAKSTYTGDFRVKGPSAILDGGGLIADIDLDGGAEVIFDLSSSYEYEGVIKGAGTVTKRGDGELTLTQASTFIGVLDVEEGSLVVKAGIDTPAPFESATYTPDLLTFEFSGDPTGPYTIFNAANAQLYPTVTLEGTTATGVYNSSLSRLAIN